MKSGRKDGQHKPFSSPPCFAHEISQDYQGSFSVVDEEQHRDVMRWRKAERQRLIVKRLGISSKQRKKWAEGIARHVAETLTNFEDQVVSFYWPFRGEPNLTPFMDVVRKNGGSCALPVVVERGNPLEFWSWKSGDPLDRGIWDIPIPSERREVNPDVVLAPAVGFDGNCFRLGYGGGYFDRTLAAMTPKPLVIGVAYSLAQIATIFPQPHDIPMSLIATEAGVLLPQQHQEVP